MAADTIVGLIWFLAAGLWTFAAYTWLKGGNSFMYIVSALLAAMDFVLGVSCVLS